MNAALAKLEAAMHYEGFEDFQYVETATYPAELYVSMGCESCNSGTPAGTTEDMDGSGYVSTATMQFWDDPSFKGYEIFLKVGLHEGGHIHGLGDTYGSNGSSIMNQLSDLQDSDDNLPTDVTPCDSHQVWEGGGTEPEQEQCSGVECSSTPLVFDVDNDGIPTTNVSSSPSVLFDLNADGVLERTAWLAYPFGDAFLWLDLDGDGTVDDGRELFGSATELPDGARAEHGWEALAVYDMELLGGDGDGLITPSDHVWSSLRLWFDTNRNGVSEAEETSTLDQYEVVAISLRSARDERLDENGNLHTRRGIFWMRRGNGLPGLRPARIEDIVFLTRNE